MTDKLKILIVDQDERGGYIVEYFNELSGFDAQYSQSLVNSLSLVKSGDFDLILIEPTCSIHESKEDMNQVLGGITEVNLGLWLHQEIKSYFEKIGNTTSKVGYLTTQSPTEGYINMDIAGCDIFIRKPEAPKVTTQKINSLFEYQSL